MSVRECILQNKPIELEKILPDINTEGQPLHPCESCGINVERQEIVERLSHLIKGEPVFK